MKSVNVHAPVQERILDADTFRVNRDGSSSSPLLCHSALWLQLEGFLSSQIASLFNPF